MTDQHLFKLLKIESRAGRVEGIFAADPALARMWRGQVALTEACRSVGLEDIHVFEGDVIHRHLENRLTDAEGARGAMSVTALLRVIVAPGDLMQDPERVVERCRRAAVSIEADERKVDLRPTARLLPMELQHAPTPLLGALRAATVFRMETQSSMPSVDRLIFMAADHTLRGGRTGRSPESFRPEALLGQIDSSWIFTPSIALTQGRFRAWSPGTRQGLHDLLDGISADLGRTLGAMPILRRWREDARRVAAGKHGRSRLRDLVELAMQEPVLTSSHVRQTLGVSERASLYLMKEAQAAGILKLITPRKRYRVWAQPQMAHLLRMRAQRGAASAMPGQVDERGAHLNGNPSDQFERADLDIEAPHDAFEERAVAALADLEAAMDRADVVLAKYQRGERSP